MMRGIGLSSFLVLACGCAHTPKAEPAPQAEHAPAMQVVPLKYAVADELGKEVMQALGAAHRKGSRIVADPRTNSLILICESEADLQSALELIARLDVEAPKAQ